MNKQLEMIDLRNESIEIKISDDSKTIWINCPSHCLLRAQEISELKLVDSRKKKSVFISMSDRAISSFSLFIGGAIIGSHLFGALGLNGVVGTLICAIVGGISGYFIGRRIERNRDVEK